MEASPASTMVGDYSVRSSSSSQNTTKFNAATTQKALRIENIASRLQSQSTSEFNGTTVKKVTNSNVELANGGKMICHQCSAPLKSLSESLVCLGCKKYAHFSCCSLSFIKDNNYICSSCKKHSIFPGTSTQAANEQDQFIVSELANNERPMTRRQTSFNTTTNAVTSGSLNTIEASSSSATNSTSTTSIAISQNRKTSISQLIQKHVNISIANAEFDTPELYFQMATRSSFTSSVDEESSSVLNSEIQSTASSPSISIINSRESPLRADDSVDSEAGLSKFLKDSNVKSKNNGAKENKRGASRQLSMKTRSGGKTSGSYTNLGKGVNEKRKPNVKGKVVNAARQRRPRGSNRLPFLPVSLNSRRESEETTDSDEPKTRQPDENDYIRTAIVSNSEDLFVRTAPMCLICGGIGKNEESTMMCCMSCCQVYHSYCINMHDKLNKTIAKRGWRCLQCTVCETCGAGTDETNLLLCDDCDIAFHIYCLEPKLDKVPTGSWRCHWCSTCRRCNKQVLPAFDIKKTDGYCESCYSLKKCPKCTRLYQVGELMIKCQHCLRWLHGECEDFTTEEELENAYENDFRCSLCRPRANSEFNDVMNQSVIIDNVMVNKSALEMLKCGRSGSSLSNLSEITGSFRSQSTDQCLLDNDDYMDDLDFNRGRGRISGPGRRPPKIGIGGFVVKNRNRAVQSIDEEDKDEQQEDKDKQAGQGKQKRRPRKPRRHQLEDAYPFVIQEAFFGTKGVDGKTVLEMTINEPNLEERHHYLHENHKIKEVFELSEQAADALRIQQEQDMIGDMLGDNLDVDIDNLDNFDFSNFLGDDDDDFEDDFANEPAQNQNTEIPQDNQPENEKIDVFPDRNRIELQKTQLVHETVKDSERVGQATKRWAEDEPLGEKANTAPVLYANLKYPHLKTQYPNWSDRAKQIHRIWRSLDAESRLVYVKKAKENRANRVRAPRRRGVNLVNRVDSQASDAGNLQIPAELELKEIKERSEIKVEFNGTSGSQQTNDLFQSTTIQRIEQKPQNVNQLLPNNNQLQQPQQNESKNIQENIIFKQISQTNMNIQNRVLQQPRVVTAEVAQKYDNLKKEQETLKKKHEQMDQVVTSWRRSKKNLAAKKRQLNKHNDVDANGQKILHELSETDQQKFEELTRNIQNHNKEIDILKRQEKDVQNQLDELEKRYSIISVTAVPSESQVFESSENFQPLMIGTSNENGSVSNLSSPRVNFNKALSSNTLQSTVLFNGNSTLHRADSISSLTDPGTPGSVRSNSAMSGEFSQQSRRGRKRKKNIIKFQRSAALGGIPYTAMHDEIERQVYDTLDYILNEVCGINELHNEPDVRKLLMTHAPPDLSLSPTFDAPRKKKRMVTKKTTPANDTCEYEVVIDKIHGSLANLPSIPSGALNPFPSFEPASFITSDTTKLPDNCEILTEGSHFGCVKLSFMDDFYNSFEENCTNIGFDHETAIRCSDLYSNIRLDLLKEPDSQEPDKIFGEFSNEPYDDLVFPNEVPREDLEQLNIDNIRDRDVIDTHIPLTLRWPEVELPPTDPPRTAWNDLTLANKEEFNIDLVVDFPEDALTDEVVFQIASILKTDGKCNEDIKFVVENAPTLSPGISCPDLDDDILECNRCQTALIDSNIYEPEVNGDLCEKYCSKECFMEYNNISEKVNVPSEEPLRIEISDKDASIPPLPTPDDENETELPISEADRLLLLESLRQPRELEYTVTELPQPVKHAVEVTPGGSRAFKYRDHGWMVFSEKLLNTFRQISVDCQVTIKDYCGNWMNLIQKDTRSCAFCGEIGDGLSDVTGRLLNIDANEWVHVNCAIWSTEVHESECGGLNNVQIAVKQAKHIKCSTCFKNGASLKCIKLGCELWYHLPCAIKSLCKFMKDMTLVCANHGNNINPDAKLGNLCALRRIYIEREENKILSKIYSNSFSCEMMMRIGSLVFYHIGQLLPDQLKTFHNADLIFPIGYKVVRIFWHPKDIDRRIPYECTIEDNNNSPSFKVTFEDKEIKDSTTHAVWSRILCTLQQNRDRNGTTLRFFPNQISGDFMYGFYETVITKIIESLPGVDQLHTYDFKHGGMPIMEVPLAVNPTGCARTEPCFRTLIKSKKTLASPQKLEDRPPSSANITNKRKRRRPVNELSNIYDEDTLKMLKASGISEDMIASGKFEANSAQIYSRYKTMKAEWKSYVALGRSRIAGFGLYAKKDICMYQMVCEYVGEMIRSEVCEIREKKYSQKNMGIYMFRIDNELVIDATKSGNMARYINHSCDPNCFTQIVNIDNSKKIVIIASRPIKSGEELCYDYQFELEDTKDKIPCLCGAPNCVKWMN